MLPIIILFAVFVCLLTFWIRRRKRKLNVFKRNGIPGPKPNFFTGNAAEFYAKKEKCIDEWREKYGNVFGFFLGGIPFIACLDVDLLKILQIKEFKIFPNRAPILRDGGIAHKLILNSLPLLRDENWKNARSILSSCFSSPKIKMMSVLISDSIKIFMEKIEKQKLKPFDIDDFYKKLTFDIICRTAFGIKTNVQNEETNRFVKSVYKILDNDLRDILIILSICFPELESILTYIRRMKDALHNALNYPSFHLIFETCQKIISTRKESGYHSSDLLQTMIEAEDDSNPMKRLTAEQIVGNAVIFMAAGYDTSSNTLSFCTHYLAQNPEIQEKVRREVKDAVKNNRNIEYADLMKFKYMDQVISETLRLHSFSAITVNRECSEDFKYKDIIIPKETAIMIPLPNLHKNEKFWPEPLKFDPDRFLHNNGESLIYQPFGAGPRFCIGMRMAQIIMKLTLATLIRDFKIEPHGNSDIILDDSMILPHPKNGVHIKAIPLAL